MSRLAPVTGWPVRLGLALMVGWLSGAAVRAQTFHAILVADTNDSLLVNACEHDLEVMHRQFVQAAAAIHYALDEQVLSGNFFSRAQLDSAINRLIVQPRDVIFLYYTGHGYNLVGRPDRFPMLKLAKNQAMAGQNPSLLSVHDQLRQKKVRL